MLGTRPTDDVTVRCEALADKVAATPVGENPEVLKLALAECDALDRVTHSAFATCRLRDLRHWLKLAYGHELHGYPPERLREILGEAIVAVNAELCRGP